MQIKTILYLQFLKLVIIVVIKTKTKRLAKYS
jgi:hypothetical protein